MATKRELLRSLKAMKKEPRALLPAECDELILLLGGTVRPAHRPETIVWGINRREMHCGAIGDIVFGSLQNAECLTQLEADLLVLENPETKTRPVVLSNLKNHIESLRPISAKNRAEAERMAVKWFASRGIKLNKKQIENALSEIQIGAGLLKLGLTEWKDFCKK